MNRLFFFDLFFIIFFGLFLILVISDFFLKLLGFVRKVMVDVYSYSVYSPVSKLDSFFTFFFLLMVCFLGFFSYSYCLLGMIEFTFIFSMISWLSTLFFFFSSEKFSVYLCKTGDFFFKSFVMSLIELVSEFSRPLALTVRLTVNVAVGHLIIDLLYYMLEFFFGNFFFWIFIMSIFMECFVFFIQSYIFSRLIYLYLNE
uniref:ATP synthase subunit a n=1 Tax=Dictyocaulus viviparus TaxID=29172 RepID=K7QM77_DICVI|nr:ATP synthase F0 subunit 6 [Dictyocaulus viviparus]AFV32110.1 ATP synthase F0 subunit 6 [Dictyocaulus viviparus]